MSGATIIIDSGGANLASLQYACERLGVPARVSAEPADVAAASHVILPGVGSASDAMQRLHASGLSKALPELRQPVLGICLGMQLLFESSEEGATACLGIIPGVARRLPARPGLPVPHMGWNQLCIVQPDPLLEALQPSEYVYFVHSYAVAPGTHTLATADYGSPLAALVRRDNFWGTQFHPERSATAGTRLLGNFLRL